MIDIALALHHLVPNAQYSGATDLNTESQYDEIRWADERPRPTFADVSSLCESAPFRLWVARLMAAPASRGDIGLSLRSAGVLTRSEAVQFANGSLPDKIYNPIEDSVGDTEAFAIEMGWAGSLSHDRTSKVVDAFASLGYEYETAIDAAFGVVVEDTQQ